LNNSSQWLLTFQRVHRKASGDGGDALPLSVVPVVPHGAANRAGESKGRFQNGSAEMARGGERERERARERERERKTDPNAGLRLSGGSFN